MLRHWVLNATALNLQFSMNHACCDIGYSMLQHPPLCQFFKFLPFSQCCGIGSSMLRYWSYCQFWSFFQCCSIGSPILRHSSIFSSLSLLHLFFLLLIPMLELTYNIKYPVNVSKMIIILTKLLSVRALKHIKFHSYQHANSDDWRRRNWRSKVSTESQLFLQPWIVTVLSKSKLFSDDNNLPWSQTMLE